MKTLTFSTLTVLFALLLGVYPACSQNHTSPDGPSIVINSTAEVAVPADIVYMQININMTHQDADRAYEEHKNREHFLADLLVDLDFDDEQISYQPIQMRPSRERDGTVQVHTNQTVNLTFFNIEQFGDVQSTLIGNGFDSFSGSFGSTESDEAEEKALAEAVKSARAKAEILAESAGKNVGEVQMMEHFSDSGRPVPMQSDMMMRASSESVSLSDFSQTITVSKTVRVVFRLVD